MPLLFRCPHCGHETWVAEHMLGRSGPCAKCKAAVTVQVGPHHPETPPPNATALAPKPAKPRKRWRPTSQLLSLAGWLAASLAGIAALTLVGWLIFRQLAPPALIAGATAAKQAEREDNFQRLAAAFQAYHNAKGHFPPAYTTDKQGKPLHSWRTLLLPYLGHRELFLTFDLEQPWDSPENLELVNEMPRVFGCPFDAESRAAGETSYLAITGSGFAFDNSQHHRLSDITDVPSETMLLIETCNTGTVWTRPKDLDGEQLIWSAHAQPGGIGCEVHDGSLWVVTADGRACRLNSAIPPEYLRALATIDGGEPESLDGWGVEQPSRSPNTP